MRATLHDELMRAAGFDVEYYQELARRRERRQRRLRPVRAVVGFVARRCGVESLAGIEPRPVEARIEARRPTLNDELMHEAGFETEYHRDLAWRRRRRRRALLWAGSLALFTAGLVETFGQFLPGVPKPLLAAALAVGPVHAIVEWVVRRIRRRREEGE